VIVVLLDGRFDPERRLPEPGDILMICSGLVLIAASTVEGDDYSDKEVEELRLAHPE